MFNLHDPNGPELCGVVLGDGTIKSVPNIHPDPHDNFAMDATVLDDPEVVATWHTHPRSGANLTVSDYLSFMSYPDLRHYIISASEIWCYRMDNDILVADEHHNFTRLSK